MEGEKPVSPRTLQPGISEDRFGMRIINDERYHRDYFKAQVRGASFSEKREVGRFFVDKQTINDL